MSATVLFMSMSLDGFIAGPDLRPGMGPSNGSERLHQWIFTNAPGAAHHSVAISKLAGVNRQIGDEILSTGAVVAGRGTFEPANGWQGDHHGDVPIHILSRHPAPDWAARWPNVTYRSDLDGAVRDARRQSGEKNVLIHGAGVAQRLLKLRELDEMMIHLIPILIGVGRPLFAHLGVDHRELIRLRVMEGEEGVTHLHYRVCR
jgi:dihydrofolate reductase